MKALYLIGTPSKGGKYAYDGPNELIKKSAQKKKLFKQNNHGIKGLKKQPEYI